MTKVFTIESSKQHIQSLGYQVVSQVHNTHRNVAYKITDGTQHYFAKFSLSKDAALMANDSWWCLTLGQLAEMDAPIKAPALIASGSGWIVEEWVEADLLVKPEFQQGDDAFTPHIQRLTDVLLWLNSTLLPGVSTFPSSAVDQANRKLDAWLEVPLREGRVSLDAVSQARQFIADAIPNLHPAFSHGDFVPWHIMASQADGGWYMFDGEHASLTKPRYYDLAYLYSRLFTRSQAAGAARSILAQFTSRLDSAERKSFDQQFLPVLTQRALGMQLDAWNDRATYDYASSATALLDLCLVKDVSVLL